MDAPESEKRDCCPVCGQVLPLDAECCPECRFVRVAQAAPDDPNASNPYVSPPAVEEENRPPFQFSLRALLIFTTYVAVLLSIGLMVPGLGILTAILLTPALLRTYFRSVQAAARGERLSGSEKAFNFIAGMAVALCIGVAWAVAIAVAAFAACLGSWNGRGQSAGLSAVLVLGGVIGLGFTIFLLWYFCIRPDRKE